MANLIRIGFERKTDRWGIEGIRLGRKIPWYEKRTGEEKKRSKRIGAMAPSGRGMKTPLPLQTRTQRLPFIETKLWRQQGSFECKVGIFRL